MAVNKCNRKRGLDLDARGQEVNRKAVEVSVCVVLVLAAAGWHYRARIVAWINPPASAAHPAEKPDVLYTWVDKDGVTHFSAEAGKGQRVEYDGSGITPMAPVESRLLAQSEALDDAGKPKPKGAAVIHSVRDDIERNQQIMRKAKLVAAGLEEPEG